MNYIIKSSINTSFNKLKGFVLCCTAFLLLPGYIIQYYLGVKINSFFFVLSSLCLLIVFQESRWRIAKGPFILIVLILLNGALGSYFSGVYSQFFIAMSLVISFLIAWLGWKYFISLQSLNLLLILCSLLIFGAIIAFLYAYTGGSPLLTIDLLGRKSFLYLTTFTNAVVGNLIRPAGIFDEPGALAMYITLIVALNASLGVNTKWSALVLFSGLVCGSLALFFVAIAYLIFKMRQKAFVQVLVIVIVIGLFAIFSQTTSKVVDSFFLKRIQVRDGRLAGDNRTHQVEAFLRLVDWDITMKGAKATGKYYSNYDLSSNPFSIYFGYGIFAWMPYLVLELWLLYCVFFYRPHLRFPAFAVFITLLQRPYIINLHWGISIAVVVLTIFRIQKSTLKIKYHGSCTPIN